MPDWIKKLLGLANEATDEQVRSAITGLQARPEASALANEQTAKTALETRIAELSTKLSSAETAFANERSAHVQLLVEGAVVAGRILEADKALWVGRLSTAFDTEAKALANAAQTLKTAPLTGALGSRKAGSSASDQFAALVNERVERGERFDDAWKAVKASKPGSDLYDQMGKSSCS